MSFSCYSTPETLNQDSGGFDPHVFQQGAAELHKPRRAAQEEGRFQSFLDFGIQDLAPQPASPARPFGTLLRQNQDVAKLAQSTLQRGKVIFEEHILLGANT